MSSKADVVLVTGATGHIGNNLCRRLLRDGAYRVRCLVRPGSDTSALEGLPVERAHGDVLDYDSFLRAAEGCTHVFHLAAVYSHNPKLADAIHETALRGTENFLRVCRRAGVQKSVYTSSVAALGVSDSKDGLIDETGRVEGECEAYTRAKLTSLSMVEAAVRQEGLPIVCVLPSTVIGERDYRITPSNHMILRFLRGPQLVYIDGGINVVYVTDVAEGHVAALTSGRPGEKYILGGENVTIHDLMSRLARLRGGRPPFIELGRNIVYPLAVLFDLLVRVTNRPAPISKMQAKTRVGRYGFYSLEKSRRELGWAPLGLDSALRRTRDWLVLRRLLRG